MSDMIYREPNMVKWTGIRPGHNGEQVLANNAMAGPGNAVIYTVPVGKTLFLTYLSFTSRLSADAAVYSYMTIYDTTPAAWKHLFRHFYDKAGQQSNGVGLFFPVEIPASYSIRIVNTAAGLDSFGVVHGWEE